MEQNANDNLPPRALCRMGCGFYGSQAWDGLCSMCYKDALKRKQNSSPVSGRASPAVMSPSGASAAKVHPDDVTAPIDMVSATFAQTSLGQETSSPDPLTAGGHIATGSAHSMASSCGPADGTSTSDVHCSTVSSLPSSVTSFSSNPSLDTASPTVLTPEAATGGVTTGSLDTPPPGNSADSGDEKGEGKPKKNRCHTCKKKVGLTGFLCRCSGLFCSQHRYSDKHGCSFDYHELAQEQIRKDNPVIRGDKLQKI